MTPTQIAIAIAFALGISIGGAGAWRWQSVRFAEKTLELTHEKLDRANERIGLQSAARAIAERSALSVIKAQNEAASRAVRAAADSQRARTELERLRLASETAVRNANSGIEACTGSLATHSQLLTQCGARLVEMGGLADDWASHAVMLQQSWPKLNSAEPTLVK